MRLTKMIRCCGVFPTAQYLKKKGYTLTEALLIIYSRGGLDKKF